MRVQLTRQQAVDAVLGLLLGWIGWASAVWARPEPGLGPDRDGRRGPYPGPPVRADQVMPGVVGFLILVVVGVAVRRIRPRLGFALVALGLGGYLACGANFGPVLLAAPLAVHAMAIALPLRQWLPLVVAFVPMVMAGYWREPFLGLGNPSLYAALVAGTALALLPALFALLRRSRRETDRREREEDRRRYLDEERLRIAREVHDVVGHSLSVITMQAGVALHVLDRSPDRVGESLEAIRSTSKAALAELRTTLGVFREADGSVPLGLRPGLDRLDELVGALVAAGRQVRVRRDPVVQPELPVAVDQAAFRIIQEALTNVVRHTGTASAVVTVTRTPDRLVLQVSDDGPAVQVPASGNGITGMQERARAVGGSVSLTVNAPRGLLVRADLPVEATS